MPTPGGLLKKGDKIRHIESGQVLVVLARSGNDITYSVTVRKEDGSNFKSNGKDTFLITEAHWVWQYSGKWELV